MAKQRYYTMCGTLNQKTPSEKENIYRHRLTTTLKPPTGFNVLVNRGLQGKKVMLAMIVRCLHVVDMAMLTPVHQTFQTTSSVNVVADGCI